MSKTTTSDKSTEHSAHQVIEETIAPGGSGGTKKKKYSSELSRNVQLLQHGQAKAAKRLAEAAAAGIGVWLEARDASAVERRDGALKDFTKNTSKALRKALKEGAEAPADFLDSVAKMKLRPRW